METLKESVDDIERDVVVQSLADGTYMVSVLYNDEPCEPGMPPVGVFTRLAIASEIKEAIVASANK